MTHATIEKAQEKTKSYICLENMHKKTEKLDMSDHIADVSKMVSLDDLEFIKLKIPRLIPIELIEAVKGRTFTPDQFYKYQEEQVKYENPGNLLYVLVDSHKKIHGYLWAEISQLDGSMFVNTFSIHKNYWHQGRSISKVVQFLEGLKSRYQCPRVFWLTTNEKFFLKHGFRRSKNCLMEYNSK